MFLSWLGRALMMAMADASSSCLQYDRSIFYSAVHMDRAVTRASLLSAWPFLMQTSWRDAWLRWQILIREALEIKLKRELIVCGLILKLWNRRPWVA
jgi:hypothetical protein